MSLQDREEQDVRAIRSVLADYRRQRLKFYSAVSLNDLLVKDVVMFALRGVSSADEFIHDAFSALESSSEETVIGSTWQRIAQDLARPAVIDAGDILAERDGTLWVVELKSQTNTLNARSSPQTIRALKARVDDHASSRGVRRTSVRAMIAVLRGPSQTTEVKFQPKRINDTNRDLIGFSYTYIVGREFWAWLTGRPNIVAFVGTHVGSGSELKAAKEQSLKKLKGEMQRLLTSKGLGTSISDLIRYVDSRS